MGNSVSSGNYSEEQQQADPWWPIENENLILNEPSLVLLGESNNNKNSERYLIDKNSRKKQVQVHFDKSGGESAQVSQNSLCGKPNDREKEQTLDEFKEELRLKRMERQEIVADLRKEISSLRDQLAEERFISRQLRDGFYVDVIRKDAETCTGDLKDERSSEIGHDHSDDSAKSTIDSRSTSLRSQVAEAQLSLQLANAEILSLSTELGVLRKQVSSLKEVITCSKQMLAVREEQITQLKGKLREIEDSLAERELKIMSDNLRQEYDRQLANIRNLRQLYEERARVSVAERENLLRQISIKKDELTTETDKTKRLEERLLNLETELKDTHKNLSSKTIQCDEINFENRDLKEEMAVVNKLFSQMLMGFNGVECLDIDRLTVMLEENRTLLNEMATTEGNSDGACLPKLLFDIVKQANTSESGDTESDEAEGVGQQDDVAPSEVVSAQEIIGNLPKVWRVLMELLNHHRIQQVEIRENGQSEDCYKSVATPSGPTVEISVSKTYIKLKDLILEKKALQKETNKLKTLNSHLERRLHEQEKRLSTVSLELTKTWHLVGKMQRQHRQLHTHEQILRYQLQQKRRLLNELKEELEYCRRKWAAARAKNDESQLQCDDLRREFASRKLQDANNSAESGYSDGPASDEDDEKPVPKVKRNYREIFEHSKKIERMNSESRDVKVLHVTERREKSAPPVINFIAELLQSAPTILDPKELHSIASTSVVPGEVVDNVLVTLSEPTQATCPSGASSGAVPKQGVKLSRGKKREKSSNSKNEESLEDMFWRLSRIGNVEEKSVDDQEKRADRAERINKLEEQCKSLIAQVIETSSCREELNDQLERFKQELEPSPSASPKEDAVEDISNVDPAKDEESAMTAREEEYTSRRAERLRRLEEESQQLMSRIKRTTDRGHNMNSVLDQLHQRCVDSREGSVDKSIVPDSAEKPIAEPKLTEEEQASLDRRAERLRRMEEESQWLMSRLAKNSQRGHEISTKLDQMHAQYGVESTSEPVESEDNKDANGAEGEIEEPSGSGSVGDKSEEATGLSQLDEDSQTTLLGTSANHQTDLNSASEEKPQNDENR